MFYPSGSGLFALFGFSSHLLRGKRSLLAPGTNKRRNQHPRTPGWERFWHGDAPRDSALHFGKSCPLRERWPRAPGSLAGCAWSGAHARRGAGGWPASRSGALRPGAPGAGISLSEERESAAAPSSPAPLPPAVLPHADLPTVLTTPHATATSRRHPPPLFLPPPPPGAPAAERRLHSRRDAPALRRRRRRG